MLFIYLLIVVCSCSAPIAAVSSAPQAAVVQPVAVSAVLPTTTVQGTVRPIAFISMSLTISKFAQFKAERAARLAEPASQQSTSQPSVVSVSSSSSIVRFDNLAYRLGEHRSSHSDWFDDADASVCAPTRTSTATKTVYSRTRTTVATTTVDSTFKHRGVDFITDSSSSPQ